MSDSVPVCRICSVTLNDDNWYPSLRKCKNYICKPCNVQKMRPYQKEYAKRNPTRYKKYRDVYYHSKASDLRMQILLHYSPDLKCQRCGFRDVRALSIDHINGGGNEHRRQFTHHIAYLRDIVSRWPDDLRVLCMNCQFIHKHEMREARRSV